MIRNGKKRILCLLLSAVLMCTVGYLIPGLTLNASAAGTPTSLGLAEHGIKAHTDKWQYVYGGKGQVISGKVRGTDCAGLIYAYFSDMGAIAGCAAGATSQVEGNCVFSNDIDNPYGIPRIHGLVLTMPDYNDPETGIYGHIGIYIGNNEATDNSDYYYNMRREPVVGSSRGWTAWHVFDNGTKYPVNGWYAMDNKMYHYTDYQYDVDTMVDGYTIGSDGVALDASGSPLAVDSSMLSSEYASASKVADYLRSFGYSGKDSTRDLIYGGGGSETPEGYNGKVTGDVVNLRKSATTKSNSVGTLRKNAYVNILAEEQGESISSGGKTTTTWYSVVTSDGTSGYVCSLYVERVSSGSGTLTSPTITAEDGYVTITAGASDADIYYTADGTEPTENSTPYTGAVYLTGATYKALAVLDGKKSAVSTATVLSNSTIFTDFSASDWFFSAVDEAVAAGIFQGNSDGTFAPNKNITRAQFVRVLANLDRVDLSQYSGGSGFSDVTDNTSKTSQAIAWAVEMGIVNGYPGNTFRPNESISREQMCQMLVNYAGLERTAGSSPFSDDSSISGWAKEAVYACRDNGLIQGVSNNRFQPKGTATRAQACTILVKYAN